MKALGIIENLVRITVTVVGEMVIIAPRRRETGR